MKGCLVGYSKRDVGSCLYTKMWKIASIATFEDCLIERDEFQGVGGIIHTSILGIRWQIPRCGKLP